MVEPDWDKAYVKVKIIHGTAIVCEVKRCTRDIPAEGVTIVQETGTGRLTLTMIRGSALAMHNNIWGSTDDQSNVDENQSNVDENQSNGDEN